MSNIWNVVGELPRIHLLRLSEKSRTGPRRSTTDCREALFGAFCPLHTGQIHAWSVARTPFRTVSLGTSVK
jgi:hypothetical protein